MTIRRIASVLVIGATLLLSSCGGGGSGGSSSGNFNVASGIATQPAPSPPA